MTSRPVISEYRPEHRPLIRSLCCDVAYESAPLEQWLPIPRDLFADIFTSFYTDFEPENCFIATVDERFAGYILLTPDTNRYNTIWRRRILLPAFSNILTGKTHLPLTVIPPLISLGLAICRCGGLSVPLKQYPGHLHINIHPDFQKRMTVSMALLSRAYQRFIELDVPGIHGIVMTSRPRMEAKFRRIGFQILKRCDAPRPPRKAGDRSRWLIIAMTRDQIPQTMLTPSLFRNSNRTLAQRPTSC